MTLRLALLFLCIAGPLRAEAPIAEVVCAPRAEMVLRLEKGFGAELRGMGLRTPEAVIEVWADDRGDWTLVQAWASGQSCILAMGENWQEVSPAQPPS